MGATVQVLKVSGTSTLAVGFIHILKNIDIDILDILEKLIIQHSELLQTCISTPLGCSHCGVSMEAETPTHPWCPPSSSWFLIYCLLSW